jgi:hypothetical protein
MSPAPGALRPYPAYLPPEIITRLRDAARARGQAESAILAAALEAALSGKEARS